jgi:hypothetical protein
MNSNSFASCQQVNHRKTPFVWFNVELFDMDLSLSETVVYLHIIRRTSHTGKCWQTAESIARDVKLSSKSVKKAIARLIQLKMVAETDLPDHVQRKNQHARALIDLDVSEWDFDPAREAFDPGKGKIFPRAREKSSRAQVNLEEEDPKKKETPSNEGVLAPPALRNRLPEVTESERQKTAKKTPGTEVWDRYANKMLASWKMQVPRSAKNAALAKRLVEEVGFDNAIALAEYYPTVPKQYYVARGHPFALLLTDAQALLRDVQTGLRITPEIAKNLESEANSREWNKLVDSGCIAEDPFGLGDEYCPRPYGYIADGGDSDAKR